MELLRRRVLPRAAFSAGVYAFCRVGRMPRSWADLGGGPRHLGHALAQQFCALLPRSLDLNVTGKDHTLAFQYAGTQPGAASVWGDSHFGLTFETCLACPGLDGNLVYVTEKPLKPMLAWRPFLVLGAKGTLAHLRDLGFRSFAPMVNESYDAIGAPRERMHAAITEVERLLPLQGEAWGAVADAVEHNVRHLACGGLRKELQRRARALLHSMLRMARAGMQARPAQATVTTNGGANGDEAEKLEAHCTSMMLDRIRADYPAMYSSHPG